MDGLLKWTQEDEGRLESLKADLVNAPVLSLPDVRRPFYLFVATEEGTAYGVLTQEWAGKKKRVGYISKLLDPISRGWPTCLQAVVAVALIVEEANKVTFGSELKVFSPHNIRGILQQKAEKWITDARLLKYEGILIHSPKLEIGTTSLQNPAQFLYGGPEEELTHNCLQTIEEQMKIRPDLEEVELGEGEKLFADGSSRVIAGKRKSGYAIVDGGSLKVKESRPLSPSWSAQACELYSVLRALELLKGKEGTVYTDSKYAYGVVHTFGKIWEERGLINSQGRGLVHEKLIVKILQAIRGPKQIAVIHVKRHQRGTTPEIQGNNLADQEAKVAALLAVTTTPLAGETPARILSPQFSKPEMDKLKEMGVVEKEGNWELPNGRQVLPKALTWKIMRGMHSKTHWGVQALVDQFAIKYMCIGVYNVAKEIVQGCLTCQRINKQHLREKVQGGRELAHRPFTKIQIDFTDLPKVGRYKHLLVLVDHLTHYVEVFPTARATANAVVKILLEHIIPRYGNIETIDSDRGPHFVSKVVKEALAPFGTKGEFHTPWHPQSSGKVERMNGEIKKQLTKLMIETKMLWVKCLPIALLNIRTQPRTDTGISPFEMLYGMPYDMECPANYPTLDEDNINPYIV